MGNNVLPARAGDAIRIVLMGPLAHTSRITVAGTLVAERVLDVAVLVVLFVVVGYGLLGEVGGEKVEFIVAIVAAAAIVAFAGWRFVRRNERLHGYAEQLASSTLGLRRAHHGLLLLGMTLVIWAIEAGVWMAVGAAVGFGMDPIEGLYLVALASIFSMIPSGPAYAGTQDAAVAIGIKALGGTGAIAVAYLLMLRFVIVVPITLAGFILLVARYGGLSRLRGKLRPLDRRRRHPAAPAASGRVRTWFAEQDGRELAAWGVLVAVALILRLVGLADRPFHHDESQDAYFSYIFRQTGDYQYNPLLHGPLRFYLTAAMYVLFGDTDFTARLAPALMGTAMIPLCFGFRRLIGRGAAFATAALLAFEPTYLYFSRFAREDIYIACITLALIVVVFRFLDRPRKYHPALIGALLALVVRDQGVDVHHGLRDGDVLPRRAAWPRSRSLVWDPVRGAGLEAWGWGLAAFAGVFTLLFTTFLTHPGGLWDGIYTGLKYWLDQQGVGRGGEPWYMYLVVLFGVEWPALLFGAIGTVAVFKRPTLLGVFLIWDFLLSLAVYSWASEKFAWLVMHPLLPLLVLSGIGLQSIWRARRGLWGKLGIVAAAIALFYAGYSSYLINAKHGADPRELLVSTQSSTQVKDVAEQVLAKARARGPGEPPLSVTIDSAEGATFPYAWYFRHLQTGYIDLQQPNAPPPTTDVVVMTETARARLANALGGYSGRPFDFRVWWVRDYKGATDPGNWWRWMTKRETWNPTGGMKEWLYTRNGGPA